MEWIPLPTFLRENWRWGGKETCAYWKADCDPGMKERFPSHFVAEIQQDGSCEWVSNGAPKKNQGQGLK
jgi:hypothetical protein